MAKLGRRFVHLNLFEELIDILNENYSSKAFELEKKKGTDELAKALKGPLEQGKVAKHLVKKMNLQDQEFVLLSGLGQCWPLLRGHSLLNALHAHVGKHLWCCFIRGVITVWNFILLISLLREVSPANYYRAFQLKYRINASLILIISLRNVAELIEQEVN